MRIAYSANRLVHRLGQARVLEKPAEQVAKSIRPLVRSTPVKNALAGTWQGHRLHPALTDVVIGSWLSAGLIDAFGGREGQTAADRLVASGLVASVPTAAAGLADYTDLYDHGRRVAFVHALAVDVAVVLQGASLVARRRGHRARGVSYSMAALAVLVAAAWLGGHLSFELGIGVNHTAFDEGPKEWDTVADSADVTDRPVVVTAGEHEVLLVRVDGQLTALANRCNHAGWKIGDGEVADGCITCPAHGSTFRLADGSVVRGPAASAQLRYEVRESGGQIHVRGAR